MDCLINYIGIKDCGTEPPSGVFINSLPGINTEIINAIADSEEVTHTNVWSDVNIVAAKRLQTDILTKLRKIYKLKRIRQAFEFIPAAGADEASSNEYRGLLLTFDYQYFTFQSFMVASVYLYSRVAATTTLKIFDRSGFELYSKEVAVVEGMNVYSVDRFFISDRLFVGFDFTTIDGVASDISSNVSSCFCKAVNTVCTECSPSFAGATRSVGGLVTTTASNAHGVGIVGSASCDYSSIVCNNKPLFTSAWLFLLGNQMLIQLLNSDRINKYTTADREKFNELKDFYQVQYEGQLEEAIAGIGLDTANDCCIECGTYPKTVTWLP
jgi:hypothetical protein